jgi:uridine kinase
MNILDKMKLLHLLTGYKRDYEKKNPDCYSYLDEWRSISMVKGMVEKEIKEKLNDLDV